MRIIRGTHRSRQIRPPKFFKARPTTDFAKESLFNIIENNFDIEDLRVLDLFSGTGSISYEFASRECRSVTAVELSKKYAAFIEKTAKTIFKNYPFYVITTNAMKFMKNRALDYDLIFADPPFDMENLHEIPDIIFNNDNLNPEAMVIVEHSSKNDFSEHKHFQQVRIYGRVLFSFFQKN